MKQWRVPSVTLFFLYLKGILLKKIRKAFPFIYSNVFGCRMIEWSLQHVKLYQKLFPFQNIEYRCSDYDCTSYRSVRSTFLKPNYISKMTLILWAKWWRHSSNIFSNIFSRTSRGNSSIFKGRKPQEHGNVKKIFMTKG